MSVTMAAVVWLTLLALSLTTSTGRATTVQQTPKVKEVTPDQNINITCYISLTELDMLCLRRLYTNPGKIACVHKKSDPVIDATYLNRTNIIKEFPNTIITISKLQENDTDVYMCEYSQINMKTYAMETFNGTGTLIIVKDIKTPEDQCSDVQMPDLLTMLIVTLSSAVIILVIVFFAIFVSKTDLIKKLCSKKPSKEAVYEEMIKI
ncbi:T-cell antigen CD7-like [Polypterus senegalus]|uniref:T-cell antigen CD7-like n=1 Tax=Polypterus senegalus TaxID=55291 RepID=UPI001963A2B2|nr:T-cell antigen CD7-like [Polypterus senegalus]